MAELFFVADIYFHMQHFAVMSEAAIVTQREKFRALYISEGGERKRKG